MDPEDSASDSLSIALVGSGGAGVMTAGNLLLEAAGRAGWYGLMTRSAGPQIRGGEAAAMLRLAGAPVHSHGDRFHILLAIDWHQADRFAAEIPLDAASLVIGDAQAGEAPAIIADSGANVRALPFKRAAKEIPGGRANMVAVGLLGALIGLPRSALDAVVDRTLSRKGEAALTASHAAVDAGMALAGELAGLARPSLPAPAGDGVALWSITGNEACGLGAVRGGVRYVAAYPITPATEILEWLAPALTRVGGVLVQAEDELASVNQIIGASFGGVPALTATSGPGLALMTESIGLAVASETPIVIVDVMRGGPSTGIPTKSEQSDLNLALYGLHGDAPHVVLAPLSVIDCLFTTQWAVHLAESMQAPALVLSDQALGQTRAVVGRPPPVAFIAKRRVPSGIGEDYERYAIDTSGVSPMAIPGTAGAQYTAEGLEHDARGTPSSRADDHQAQLDKRDRKLRTFDYGDHWAEIEGDDGAECAVITWGSSSGPVREAVGAMRAEHRVLKSIVPRLLAPVQPERMGEALAGVRRLLVVEQSHGQQFYRYLRAHYELPEDVDVLSVPGPLPIRPGQVQAALGPWSQA